jgi:hypothetical protein
LPASEGQAGLRQAIAEADQSLARLEEDYEVLVIDAGSHVAAADEASRRPHVRLPRHPVNPRITG